MLPVLFYAYATNNCCYDAFIVSLTCTFETLFVNCESC